LAGFDSVLPNRHRAFIMLPAWQLPTCALHRVTCSLRALMCRLTCRLLHAWLLALPWRLSAVLATVFMVEAVCADVHSCNDSCVVSRHSRADSHADSRACMSLGSTPVTAICSLSHSLQVRSCSRFPSGNFNFLSLRTALWSEFCMDI